LARRSQRLGHLESLIADWHIDGDKLYTAWVGDEIAIGDGLVSSPISPPLSLSEIELAEWGCLTACGRQLEEG
jgi:hypothetical protein